MNGQKINGRDEFLEKLAMYKGFLIKYVALIFHDDIMPKEITGEHYHLIERFVFWFLVLPLFLSFLKIVILSITDIRSLWENFCNSQSDETDLSR